MSGDNRNIPGVGGGGKGAGPESHSPQGLCGYCGGVTGNAVATNNGQVVYANQLEGDVNFFCEGSHEPRTSDIARLTRETDANLRLMARNLRLPGAGGGATVDRALFPTLVHDAGDFLLTGEPGTGKTGLMYQLARHHRESGLDVVLLEATRFAEDVNNRLSGTLHEALDGWAGTEPGYLLIDAVDGDRGAALGWLADTVELLRDTRWRTVVSARRFDIAHNRRWHGAFRGDLVITDPGHQAAELRGVRHFLVGDFTPEELAKAGALLPALDGVITDAALELRALLANPFNLFLACELLQSGDWPEPSAQGLDRVSLLRRYWSSYVTDQNGRARNRLLGELCRMMLDRHRLQVSGEHLSAEHDEALRDLTANGVLRQIQPHYTDAEPSVVFGHHILFDYAVAQRVFVHEGSSVLVERLDQQPNLVFVARPGIDLHLEETWRGDPTRARFAALAWELVKLDQPLVGIAAAAIVVDGAESEQDLAWLIAAARVPWRTEDACAFTGWLLGVLGLPRERDQMTRASAVRLWSYLATALAEELEIRYRVVLANRLHRLLQRLDGWDPLCPTAEMAVQRANCVAKLMSLALQSPERASWSMAASAYLPAAIAVDNSHAALIDRCVADEHLEYLKEQHSGVFQSLLEGVCAIAQAAPETAVRLLSCVWEHTAVARGSAPSVHRKLPARTSRPKLPPDVQYEVGQSFAAVIPLIGVGEACRVLAAASEEDFFPELPEGQYPLSTQSTQGDVVACPGSLEHGAGHGAPKKILEALLRWAAEGEVEQSRAGELVRHLVHRIRHPDAWKRVLTASEAQSETWRPHMIELLESGGLLANPETRFVAAKAMRDLCSEATHQEHAALERAVLAAACIAAETAGGGRGHDLWELDGLVPYLDTAQLSEPLLLERWRSVNEAGGAPSIVPAKIEMVPHSSTFEGRFGAGAAARMNQGQQELVFRLDKLINRTHGENREAIEALTTCFQEVAVAQEILPELDAHPMAPVAATVARAAERLARVESMEPISDAGRLIRHVLLRTVAIQTQVGADRPTDLWSVAARRTGALGLAILLARRDLHADAERGIRDALRPLLNDPDEGCRSCAAEVAHLLVPDPVSALSLIKGQLQTEESPEVGGNLAESLGAFVAEHGAQVDEALYEATFGPWLTTVHEGAKVDLRYLGPYIRITLHRALNKQSTKALSLAEYWCTDPTETVLAGRAVQLIEPFLSSSRTETRQQAFALMQTAAASVERIRGSEPDRQADASHVAGSIASAIRDASGAPATRRSEPSMPPPGFCALALPVLDKLSAFRDPMTVHGALRTLAHLASEDPAGTLTVLHRLIDRDEHYGFDLLAEQATMALCGRYLSEFRDVVLAEDHLLSALREVIAALVHAGWPSAIDLSYRLSDAFR